MKLTAHRIMRRKMHNRTKRRKSRTYRRMIRRHHSPKHS